jgi:hypothetical protein
VIPDLLGADQPERRILRQSLRIVHILGSCQPTVDGLSQQVGTISGDLGRFRHMFY